MLYEVITGNLCPDGAVVKQSAVAESMMRRTGTARVFDGEDEAGKAILAGEIKPGDVVIIRYEGPQGGVITSYSIHYTKLYELEKSRRQRHRAPGTGHLPVACGVLWALKRNSFGM